MIGLPTHRSSRRQQRGQALIPVLGASLGALLLVTAMLAYAMRDIPLARHDQEWNGALPAAEAGIDDYLYRLNKNSNYWTYSTTNLPPSTDPNAAFSGPTPVSGVSSDSKFRYDVVSPPTATQPLRVNITGQVGKSKRSVQAILRRRSFLDYLWFTDYETKDPASYDGTDSLTVAQAGGTLGTNGLCTRHQWETPTRSTSCSEIAFLSGDTVQGPVHTNDTLNICGNPNFAGPTVTTGKPNVVAPAKMYWNAFSCTNNPSFPPTYPTNATGISMPPNNDAIKEQVNSALGGTGCLYTGPTRITLSVVGGVGTMDVVSPFSTGTNPVTGAARNRNGCSVGTGLPLPPNGVVYVQNVPASSTDPNYTNACNAAGFYPTGLPPAATPPARADVTPYGCTDGDVFLSGTLKGQLTIAAQHNIDIVGNTVYTVDPSTGNGTDVLGLVANQYVEIYHPVQCNAPCTGSSPTYTNLAGSLTNPQIHAAILSVLHSYRAQNPKRGNSLGTITLKGSIAQKYRGLVTQSGAGYLKNYSYDTRLKFLSPPYFLDPVQSAWQVQKWYEIKTPAGW